MESLWDLCDMLDDEVRNIVKKGDISPAELESMYKAVDIIKDIKTIDAMENADYSYDYSRDSYGYGGSHRGSYDSYDSSYDGRRGRDGDSDGRYSERRGRDHMGRYTSRDGHSNRGYSNADDKEQMLQKIAQMKQQIEQMQ